MDTLEEKVNKTISWYSGGGLNAHSYYFQDWEKHVHAVVNVDDSIRRFPALIVVMVRIEAEHVIIEADNTDKPLVDRLVDAGVPRDRIIKYYAGEPLPEGLKQPADLSIP